MGRNGMGRVNVEKEGAASSVHGPLSETAWSKCDNVDDYSHASSHRDDYDDYDDDEEEEEEKKKKDDDEYDDDDDQWSTD